MVTAALFSRYSESTARISAASILVRGTVLVIAIWADGIQLCGAMMDWTPHASALLSPHRDSWWLLVEPYAEALELVGEDGEIFQRLQDVENNEDQVACPGNRYDLTSSTFAVFGPFNNT